LNLICGVMKMNSGKPFIPPFFLCNNTDTDLFSWQVWNCVYLHSFCDGQNQVTYGSNMSV
jgi:hypothetical protein